MKRVSLGAPTHSAFDSDIRPSSVKCKLFIHETWPSSGSFPCECDDSFRGK